MIVNTVCCETSSPFFSLALVLSLGSVIEVVNLALLCFSYHKSHSYYDICVSAVTVPTVGLVVVLMFCCDKHFDVDLYIGI